jgi:segregation and condensation protein A
MTYAVKLDVFEGPLDLLLHLVTKERVDVAEVSISSITEEYLKAVRALEEIDLEAASSFLVLAATLLELKTIKLLPSRSIQDPELLALLEERDHLVHRLIEYSTFKKVSEALKGLLDSGEGYHARMADIPSELISKAPDLLEGVTAERLRGFALRALTPQREVHVDTSYVAPIRVSVREMIDELAERVRQERTISFKDLCRDITSRIHVIVRFLAVLELYKTQSVDIEQTESFGEIVIRWRQPLFKERSDE